MKKAFLALALALGLTATSCLGPDKAYNHIKNWNAELSDQDWLNEIVFLGLHIIPVYPLSLWADWVVLNTITYWGSADAFGDPGAWPGFTMGD
jgi:hypothetical protein